MADLIGSIDDGLPTDLNARKEDYLRVHGLGRNRSRLTRASRGPVFGGASTRRAWSVRRAAEVRRSLALRDGSDGSAVSPWQAGGARDGAVASMTRSIALTDMGGVNSFTD